MRPIPFLINPYSYILSSSCNEVTTSPCKGNSLLSEGKFLSHLRIKREKKGGFMRKMSFYDFNPLFLRFWKGKTENDTNFWLSCWNWSFFLRFTIEYSSAGFSGHIHQFFFSSRQKHLGVCINSFRSLGYSSVPCLCDCQGMILLLEWIMAFC